MSNEWTNLSEGFANRQKQLASIKVKKKTPIYKHIVIKKIQKNDEESKIPEVEIKNEFLLLPKNEGNQKSRSFCGNKNQHHTGMYYSQHIITEAITRFTVSARESALDVHSMKAKQELPTFLMNSRVKLGKKLLNHEKQSTLLEISRTALNIQEKIVNFLFYYDEVEKKFNAICYGDAAPTSDCCKINLIVQCSYEFGGKILCPHRNCVLQCLGNFIISKENREILWETVENERNYSHDKAKMKYSNEYEHKTKKYFTDSFYFGNSTTITIPKDSFSVYINPLQKVLKSHKKLWH